MFRLARTLESESRIVADLVSGARRSPTLDQVRDVLELRGEPVFADDAFDGHGPADCSPREIGGVR